MQYILFLILFLFLITLILFQKSSEKTFFAILCLIALIPIGRAGILELSSLPVFGHRTFIPLIGGIVLVLLFADELAVKKTALNIHENSYGLLAGMLLLLVCSALLNKNVLVNLDSILSYLQCLILLVLIVALAQDSRHLIKIGWILIVSIFCLSIVICLERKGLITPQCGFFRSTTFGITLSGESWKRTGSTLGDANLTALQLNVAVPFIFYYVFIYKNIFIRFFLLFAGATTLLAVSFSVSMGGMIGLLSIFLLITLLKVPSYGRKQIFALVLVVLVMFSIRLYNDPNIVSRVRYKLSLAEEMEFRGATSGRTITTICGLKTTLEHPLFGTGVTNLASEAPKDCKIAGYSGPHNTFFYIGSEGGLLCLSLFLLFVFKTLKRFYKSLQLARSLPEVRLAILGNAIFVSLIAFLIQSLSVSSPKSLSRKY